MELESNLRKKGKLRFCSSLIRGSLFLRALLLQKLLNLWPPAIYSSHMIFSFVEQIQTVPRQNRLRIKMISSWVACLLPVSTTNLVSADTNLPCTARNRHTSLPLTSSPDFETTKLSTRDVDQTQTLTRQPWRSSNQGIQSMSLTNRIAAMLFGFPSVG